MALAYTICFCHCGELVLMLYRNKPPNQHRWNGLGGKLQREETPLACVQREIMEEAGIDLQEAQSLYFAGIVTWNLGVDSIDPAGPIRGMYAFIADLPPQWPLWEGNRTVSEGLLAWKPIPWVCDPANGAVVENIPCFLPPMLAERVPREYYCGYRGNCLTDMIVRPLPKGIKETE